MRNGPDRLRALNVPHRVEVELDPNGLPAKIGMQSDEEEVMVTIETVRETWRIDDEWWREPITRTYHEVLLQGGARLVLFVDLVTRKWFVQKP